MNHRWIYHSRTEYSWEDLEVMTVNEYFIHPKSPKLEFHHMMRFSIIPRTPLFGWGSYCSAQGGWGDKLIRSPRDAVYITNWFLIYRLMTSWHPSYPALNWGRNIWKSYLWQVGWCRQHQKMFYSTYSFVYIFKLCCSFCAVLIQ